MSEVKHPIENLMMTAMTSLESMVDVNTIVGDMVSSPDGTVIIPVSKVCFGFAAGGSEFNTNKLNKYSALFICTILNKEDYKYSY